jgi:hypothetical protein
VERCSDGVDRNRQDWLAKECHMYNNTHTNECSPSERRFMPSVAPSYELPPSAPAIGIRHVEEETSGEILIEKYIDIKLLLDIFEIIIKDSKY